MPAIDFGPFGWHSSLWPLICDWTRFPPGAVAHGSLVRIVSASISPSARLAAFRNGHAFKCWVPVALGWSRFNPRLMASFTGVLANVLGLSVDIGLRFPAYVVLVAGAALLNVVPISLADGELEVSMVALFGAVGVAPERAFALSVLWGLLPLLISLPSGLAWLAPAA